MFRGERLRANLKRLTQASHGKHEQQPVKTCKRRVSVRGVAPLHPTPPGWCGGSDEDQRLCLLISGGWKTQFQRVLLPSFPWVQGPGQCVRLSGITGVEHPSFSFPSDVGGAQSNSHPLPGAPSSASRGALQVADGTSEHAVVPLVCIQPALGSARCVWCSPSGKGLLQWPPSGQTWEGG